ncbi:MAG: flagellar biosynthetic protein FliR [Candidatus Margulisiibacteriota bacterium]
MISQAQIEVFFFIAARLSGLFIQAPFFSSRSVPFAVKSALVIWLSIILWFIVPYNHGLPTTTVGFLTVIAAEVFLGFVMGFACNIILTAIQSGGEIIDLQMGLSVASALDPIFGSVISIIGRLIFFVALIIFITIDGHHMLLSAFHQSFTTIPAGTIANFFSDNLAIQMIKLGSDLWLIAIKIAIPTVLFIFLIDFSFGIVSRVAPQVNVFMLGFQVKPIVGLLGIMVTLPLIVNFMEHLLEKMMQNLVYIVTFVK